MQKGRRLALLLTALATVASAAAALQAGEEQIRPLVHPSLPNTEFHLFLDQPANSQQAAEAFCRQRQLASVSTREVRYFWKQLPYNMSFYLGSRIEMTTDHPEIERGEVLCFPLRRVNEAAAVAAATAANNDMRVLHRTAAGSNSCQASVTSVLCKRQLLRTNCTDQLMPLGGGGQHHLATEQQEQDQKKQQQQQQQREAALTGAAAYQSANGFVCLSGPLLWTLTAGTGALLLVLAAAAIILAACSVRLKRQLACTAGGFGGFGYRCLPQQASARRLLMEAVAAGVAKQPLHGGGSSRASGAALDTEDGGGFFL